MGRLWFVISFAGLLCFPACNEDASIQKEQLNGHWAVFRAERDGKNTTLLNGAVFQFQEDGSMNTNITGQEISGTYSLEANKITFQSSPPMAFTIGTLEGDTLSMTTELQGMNFILDLYRTNTESQ